MYANANPIINIDPSGQFSIAATMIGLYARATVSQIFTNIYLPVVLQGGATLATVGLMKPGFDLRNFGLNLIPSDIGFELYNEGGQMIAEAAKFLTNANAIIDYGLAAQSAFGLFTNPAKVVGLFQVTNVQTSIRAMRLSRTIAIKAEDLIIVTNEVVETIEVTSRVTQIRRVIKDYSEKILDLIGFIFDIYSLL